MAKKAKSKSTTTQASSWWKERSKIAAVAKTTGSKPTKAKPKKARVKKEKGAEKCDIYYCETCGCEMVCVEPSEEAIVCCGEPMCVMI
jgi:hypothetical protein